MKTAVIISALLANISFEEVKALQLTESRAIEHQLSMLRSKTHNGDSSSSGSDSSSDSSSGSDSDVEIRA